MSTPKLVIQTDTPEEDANKTVKFLQYVILRQGVGMNPMSAAIDPHSLVAYPEAPVITLGKKSMAPWMNGETRVSEYHGHIHYEGNRLVGHTFGADSVIKEPNYLSVVIQEISNLLTAASNPSVLDRPASIHDLPPFMAKDNVVDLEWDAKNRVTVVGVAHSGDEAYSSHDVANGLELVREAIRDGKRIIGHNIIAADLPHIGRIDDYSFKYIADTKILAHIVHAHFAQLGLLDLGSLVRFYFPTVDWKHCGDNGLDYNSFDCAYNFRLFEALSRDLTTTGQEHLVTPAQELHAITLSMTDRGIRIDGKALEALVNEKAERKNSLRSQLSFNPNSPKQIKEFLAKRKIYVNDCTSATMEKLQKSHKGKDPELDALFKARVDTKSITTWFEYEADKAGKYIGSDDYIHPRFSVTGTAVARLSSSGPNFQNLPPEIRHLIVPRSSELEFVAADAAQGENRWVAFLAEDDAMLAGFDAGIDNHQAVADRISEKFGMVVSRNFAKTIVHASNYGEKPFNLANRLFGNVKHDSLRKAEALQNAYFAAYPKTREWQLRVMKQLNSGDLMLRNPFGRVRFIYEMTEHDRLKTGCHFLGCSSLADMVNQRAVQIYKELKLVPVLIVHDELVYEVQKGDLKTRRAIWEILTQRVPEQGNRLGAWEMKVGTNYGKYSETNQNGLKKVEMPTPMDVRKIA